MDLSIVIVNYRSKDKLAPCLASLAAADLRDLQYEVIIVENNSGDFLGDLNTFDLENLKIIISPRNLGMGGGNNLGIREATGRFILVLNPDTKVTPAAIKLMKAYLEANPITGLIGPKLFYPDGSLQLSCSRFPKLFIPILRRTFLGRYFKRWQREFTMADFDHATTTPVDWLMGSCLLFKKEYLLASEHHFHSLFDERYFMYFEDIDLARQFWSNGLAVVYYPTAVVIHDHQRDSAKYPWYQAIFYDRLARAHIGSWLKYFLKWGLNSNRPNGRH